MMPQESCQLPWGCPVPCGHGGSGSLAIPCTWGLGSVPKKGQWSDVVKAGTRTQHGQGMDRDLLCPGSWATPSHHCDAPQISPCVYGTLLRLPRTLLLPQQLVLAGPPLWAMPVMEPGLPGR